MSKSVLTALFPNVGFFTNLISRKWHLRVVLAFLSVGEFECLFIYSKAMSVSILSVHILCLFFYWVVGLFLIYF